MDFEGGAGMSTVAEMRAEVNALRAEYARRVMLLLDEVEALRAERDDAVRLLAKLRDGGNMPGGVGWCDHEFGECLFCETRCEPSCPDRQRAEALCAGVNP